LPKKAADRDSFNLGKKPLRTTNMVFGKVQTAFERENIKENA
jgi:hypothetical protein